MILKVKWKLTILILSLLIYNFFSISEARRRRKWQRKQRAQALKSETWKSEWSTECGLPTSENRYPWIAAIYSYEHIACYGTIISPYHIVTVLHCLPAAYVYHRTKLNRRRFTIVAGRHNRNIHDEISSQQNRKIKEIIRYEGNKFFRLAKERDILLLEIDKAFKFSDDVRPVCVDWQSFFEEWYFRDGNEGIVVGWKFHEDDMVPCSSTVQYWQKHLCWENLPENFRMKFFGNDKYCARYIDDNSTCSEAIGAGLFFKAKEDRYFLRGIISIFDEEWKKYILYRKISTYLEWLKICMKRNKSVIPLFETLEKSVYKNDGGCILPNHIQYGKFSLITGKTYPEKTWVPLETTILLSCDDSNETTSFYCSTFSKWDPSISTAVCKRPGSCPTLIDSESERIFCQLNSSPISCEEPPTSATAVIICEPFHTFSGYKPIYKCQDRKWDPPFTPCMLECGTKRVDATTLTIGGTETRLNEYPWIVALYYKDVQVCGGTLISKRYVLSAAHCFVNFKGVHSDKDEFTIIAGKYYRSITIEETGSQKRKIKSLHVHDNYRGSSQKYRDDIALIELNEKFTVSLEVQPICIDWENSFENVDFTGGRLGVVAGWGYTKEGGSPSNVLKKILMPFQPKEECLKHFPKDFSHEFVATDKFCAGYIDKNINVCEGDSGGGIYFKSDGMRYFLRGIVSLTRKSGVGCDANHFSLYTKVSKYLPWIEKITRKVL